MKALSWCNETPVVTCRGEFFDDIPSRRNTKLAHRRIPGKATALGLIFAASHGEKQLEEYGRRP